MFPGMACSELEFAIRSLGFPVSYDEVQDWLVALEFLGCHFIEVKSIKAEIFLGIYIMYHSNGKVAKRIMYNHFDHSIAVTTLPFASHFIAGEKHMCTNLETTRLLMVMMLLCSTKGQQYILGQSGACLIIWDPHFWHSLFLPLLFFHENICPYYFMKLTHHFFHTFRGMKPHHSCLMSPLCHVESSRSSWIFGTWTSLVKLSGLSKSLTREI